MARKAESNGAIETLRRLFGTDQDCKLVSKYARESRLKNHLEASPGIVFKRSPGCDNLIKNLLALDSVFNSQKLVTRLADGEVQAAELHQEIERARERLEQKLQAYGYWVDRLNSLEVVLREQPSLEDFALEDRLSVDVQGKTAGKGATYALRAVQLLEKVEEQGRISLLSPDQLNEKLGHFIGWACLTRRLRRLGKPSRRIPSILKHGCYWRFVASTRSALLIRRWLATNSREKKLTQCLGMSVGLRTCGIWRKTDVPRH